LRRIASYIPALIIPLFLPVLIVSGFANDRIVGDYVFLQNVARTNSIPPPDSTGLRYPFRQKSNDPFSNSGNESPLYLKDPKNIERVVEYDPATGTYSFTEKIGNRNYGTSGVMSY